MPVQKILETYWTHHVYIVLCILSPYSLLSLFLFLCISFSFLAVSFFCTPLSLFLIRSLFSLSLTPSLFLSLSLYIYIYIYIILFILSFYSLLSSLFLSQLISITPLSLSLSLSLSFLSVVLFFSHFLLHITEGEINGYETVHESELCRVL